MRSRVLAVLTSVALVGGLLAVTTATVLAATPIYVDVALGNDANPGTSPGAGAKKTINAGIGAVDPGGTVIVAAGVYPEYVVINKSVTLQGANSGVSCLQSPRATESVIIGDAGGTGAVQILADNVTVNGFQISDPANALGSGIHSNNTNSGYRVMNNLITNNQIGMFADSDGASWITCNIFDGNNQPGSSAGSGIYSDYSVGLTVDRNRFVNHNTNWPVYFDFSGIVTYAHTTLTFSNNWLDNYWSGAIFHEVDGGSITGNNIKAIDATLIGIEGNSRNVSITFNVLHDGARGVRIEDVGLGPNTNIDVNRNSLTDLYVTDPVWGPVYGIGHETGGHTGDVDGTCNWWGAANGPGPVGSGSGVPVTTDVDFTPWLTTSDLNGPCQLDLAIAKKLLFPIKRFFFSAYRIDVSNVGGGPTTGQVTVTDTVPTGLKIIRVTGTGWNCNTAGQTVTCWRNNSINYGDSYPPITIKFLAGLWTPSSVTNTATVSGGGDQNSANNSATVQSPVASWFFL